MTGPAKFTLAMVAAAIVIFGLVFGGLSLAYERGEAPGWAGIAVAVGGAGLGALIGVLCHRRWLR